MISLDDLALFVRVADQGGFAAAGRALGMPKSTLSKRIAVLERHLGARLIQRSSRSFVVTELGREVHRHATAMLIEAEAARAAVQGRLAEPSGTVRITASVPSAQLSLAPVLPELASRYPKLRLVVHATDRFVDLVQEGFDLALRAHYAPLPDSGLMQRRIGFEPIHLVAAPDYLVRRGPIAAPPDLAEHDGLLAGPAEGAWRLRDGQGKAVEVAPRPRFLADEATLLLEAAQAGLGIACLPRKLCRARIKAGALVRILPDWTAGGVTTTVLVPHRRGLLPSVRAVIDFLAERLADRPREGEMRAAGAPQGPPAAASTDERRDQ